MSKKYDKEMNDNLRWGLILRESRKKYGLPLEEVAEDICDPSYLSKIERGVASPSPEVRAKVSQKLQPCLPEKAGEFPHTLFKDALLIQDFSLNNCFLANNLTMVEIKLLNFFKAVLLNVDQNQLNDLEMTLKGWLPNLELEDHYLFWTFAGIRNFKNNNFTQANHCFYEALDLTEQITYENPLIYYYLAKYHHRINENVSALHFLERAETLYEALYAHIWVFECGKLWIEWQLNESYYERITMKLNTLENLCRIIEIPNAQRDLYFLYGLIHAKKNDMQIASQYFKKMISGADKVPEILLLPALIALFHRQNKKDMLQLIDKVDGTTLTEHGSNAIEYFYYKFYDKNLSDFELFLKEDAIPLAKKEMQLEFLSIYVNELVQLYYHNKKYKQAITLYQEIQLFYQNSRGSASYGKNYFRA